jgi:FAD/FMN-containing dehydrogenase
MKLAMRYLPKYILRFIPEALMVLRGLLRRDGGLPKLVLLVEYSGKSESDVSAKLDALKERLRPFKVPTHRAASEREAEKYWKIRRESFNLLRSHVRNARTAPFVDDVVVKPKDMPAFLPRMREILDSYKLTYTIAGHAGNGNFHIIPLMDMHDRRNVGVIKEVGEKIYDLVGEFHGSITAEHNDGIVRTPYLGKMFSPEVLDLFRQTKQIFDPKNIFNPGKKVPVPQSPGGEGGGSIGYMASHIAIE